MRAGQSSAREGFLSHWVSWVMIDSPDSQPSCWTRFARSVQAGHTLEAVAGGGAPPGFGLEREDASTQAHEQASGTIQEHGVTSSRSEAAPFGPDGQEYILPVRPGMYMPTCQGSRLRHERLGGL